MEEGSPKESVAKSYEHHVVFEEKDIQEVWTAFLKQHEEEDNVTQESPFVYKVVTDLSNPVFYPLRSSFDIGESVTTTETISPFSDGSPDAGFSSSVVRDGTVCPVCATLGTRADVLCFSRGSGR